MATHSGGWVLLHTLWIRLTPNQWLRELLEMNQHNHIAGCFARDRALLGIVEHDSEMAPLGIRPVRHVDAQGLRGFSSPHTDKGFGFCVADFRASRDRLGPGVTQQAISHFVIVDNSALHHPKTNPCIVVRDPGNGGPVETLMVERAVLFQNLIPLEMGELIIDQCALANPNSSVVTMNMVSSEKEADIRRFAVIPRPPTPARADPVGYHYTPPAPAPQRPIGSSARPSEGVHAGPSGAGQSAPAQHFGGSSGLPGSGRHLLPPQPGPSAPMLPTRSGSGPILPQPHPSQRAPMLPMPPGGGQIQPSGSGNLPPLAPAPVQSSRSGQATGFGSAQASTSAGEQATVTGSGRGGTSTTHGRGGSSGTNRGGIQKAGGKSGRSGKAPKGG